MKEKGWKEEFGPLIGVFFVGWFLIPLLIGLYILLFKIVQPATEATKEHLHNLHYTAPMPY